MKSTLIAAARTGSRGTARTKPDREPHDTAVGPPPRRGSGGPLAQDGAVGAATEALEHRSAGPGHGTGADARGFVNGSGGDVTAKMERLVAEFGRMYRDRNEALQELTRAHHDAMLRLARAAESRDDDTGVHIVRIGYLSSALALHLGLSAQYALLLRQAAPLHDIGKIAVPDTVLRKPGAFDERERAIVNEHPRIGAELLGRTRLPLFQLAAEVALTHHERFNGSGYPSGLSADDIPLSGRIVAVVDFFDALTTDRCYRCAFSDAQALEMLAAGRGTQFDGRIVDAFLRHRDELVALRDEINRREPDCADLSGLPDPVSSLAARWAARVR